MSASPKRWLREPLLHFLVAGLLLFATYRMLHPELSGTTELNRIELTADDLRQLESSGLRSGAGRRRRRSWTDSSKAAFVRRSCIARPSPSASIGATPSSSAGWRRKWNFSPTMPLRCATLPPTSCAPGMQGTPNALPSPAADRSDTCTFLRIVAATRRARQPRVRYPGWQTSRPMCRSSGRPVIHSCFRITTPIVHRSRSLPSSEAGLPPRSTRFSQDPGKDRSSRAWAGIWCS